MDSVSAASPDSTLESGMVARCLRRSRGILTRFTSRLSALPEAVEMSPFLSGSAWAMTRDIANGHMQVTDRTFRQLTRAEMNKLSFELDRFTRELRGDQPDLSDIMALRERNQKLGRLTRVSRMIQLWRMENKQ